MFRSCVLLAVVLAGCSAPPDLEPEAALEEGESSSARVLDPGCTGSIYSSIQAAINASASNDIIEVCPGTYFERLTIAGKNVTLRSKGGAGATIIDAQEGGRAISVRNGADAVIEGFTFQNGVSIASGGNVYCVSAQLELRDSVVTGGRAKKGGGLGSNSCTGLIENLVIENNSASDSGGGAWIKGDGMTFDGNDLRSNVADDKGGGLYLLGSSTVRDNTFEYNNADRGGGAYIKRSVGQIVGNTVLGNIAMDDGGGIYVNDGNPLIDGNTFEANEADSEGGGLRIKVAEAVITNNTFLANHADWRGGGSRISHDEVVMSGNTWIGNTSWGTGGALLLFESASHLSDEYYEDNVADHGGAIAVIDGWGSVLIEDSTFVGNRGRDEGGHFWIQLLGYNTTLRRVNLVEGDSDVGGAIYAITSGVRLENTLLYANTADVSGGALYLDGATGHIRNSVAYSNDAPEGSVLTVVNALAALEVKNTVFNANTGGAVLHLGSGVAPMVRYSDFHSNTANVLGMFEAVGSNGNIGANPNFINAQGGDFQLAAGSALINAGDPAVNDPDGSRSDIGLFGGPHAQ